ncbi:Predicted arabinose efflux permease, MFS family [Amycolatopsis arida]|uniref:Predicted arabinose efflux permease, MFS family n=1 Tax=Amycolatopsis arida TaxID=587909 RepID=A0A1I5XSD6_9PSEU|nr:MFS transporter [Amycolatopsis arida]TDX97291.1 putative MFS family arabinose efflux permease [Amycolatopsis arida]SFQ34843.1 Predicted arabinose efflux permease, MFS family [Amycolatopsis arida]
MSGPALLVLALAATGSVATASTLLAGLTVAAAVGGPVLGALLDRSARPGRLLAGALAAYATGLVLLLAGAGHLPTAALLAVAVLTGVLNPALSGGWTAQLPLVAAGPRFARATALDAMTFNAAGLVGPALAGLLADLAGAPAGMVGAVALVTAALPAAVTLPRRPHPDRPPLIHGLRAGVRALAASRPLLAATTASVVSMVGNGLFVVCSPLLGARLLGDPGRGALLLAAVAAAALLANAALARRPGGYRPDPLVPLSGLLIGTGVAVTALATSPALVVAAVLLVGLGEGPQLTALFAIRHREAPDAVRAQVFTTGASVKLTGFALGSALAGPLAAWSVPGCLLVAAAVELLAALTFLACRAGRAPVRAG